tara:strand:- start:140 stop:253 length:114 start_codon:yes stop_codon:yes gene_type:complete
MIRPILTVIFFVILLYTFWVVASSLIKDIRKKIKNEK